MTLKKNTERTARTKWRLNIWFVKTTLLPLLALGALAYYPAVLFLPDYDMGLIFFIFFFIFFLFRDYKYFWQVTGLEYVTEKVRRVNDVTESLRKTTNLDDLLKVILINLTEDLKFDRAYLFLKKEGKEETLVGMTRKKEEERLIWEDPFEIKMDNIIGKTVRDQEAFIVENSDKDDRVGKEVREVLDLKHFATVPLSSKKSTFGAIVVGKIRADFSETRKRRLRPKDLVILSIFTNQAAVTIENIQLYSQLEELASRDGLTSLFNNRYFQEFLAGEMARVQRYGETEEEFSVILMDIDNFKHYNDTNGHLAGDTVLSGVGAILKEEVRDTDIAARYGGEEFVVLLPKTPTQGAMELANRICQRIASHPFDFRAKQPLGMVSVSVGVATFCDTDSQGEDIVSRADRGLYQAKNAGKNRVVFMTKLEEKREVPS